MKLKDLIVSIILAPLFIVVAAAQAQDSPKPDRWHDLILDQSTPDDVIKVLGQPKSDRPGGARTYPLNERLTIDHNSKDFRKLSYEKVAGMDHADLIFKDNKLVLIELHPMKSILATSLPNLYRIEFVPKIGKMDRDFHPQDYEQNQGKVYPKNYPVAYFLVALTKTSYVSAYVNNSSAKSVLFGSSRGSAGGEDTGGFPGKVEIIQIISRTLENRAGADVLK